MLRCAAERCSREPIEEPEMRGRARGRRSYRVTCHCTPAGDCGRALAARFCVGSQCAAGCGASDEGDNRRGARWRRTAEIVAGCPRWSVRFGWSWCLCRTRRMLVRSIMGSEATRAPISSGLTHLVPGAARREAFAAALHFAPSAPRARSLRSLPLAALGARLAFPGLGRFASKHAPPGTTEGTR